MNNYKVKEDELLFAKVKPNAIIPSKNLENAGMDVYACFDEDFLVIPAHETRLIPTGISSALNPKFYIQLEERGSTGSKGIKRSAGVIDSGFRGEWFVCLTNTTSNDIIITKLSAEELADKHGEKYPPWIDEEDEMDTIVRFGEHDYDYVVLKYASNIHDDITFYPYSKAIAQAIVHEVPKMIVSEIDYEDLVEIPSKRGTGALGSSNK